MVFGGSRSLVPVLALGRCCADVSPFPALLMGEVGLCWGQGRGPPFCREAEQVK